jgi:hypothetical protein
MKQFVLELLAGGGVVKVMYVNSRCKEIVN